MRTGAAREAGEREREQRDVDERRRSAAEGFGHILILRDYVQTLAYERRRENERETRADAGADALGRV